MKEDNEPNEIIEQPEIKEDNKKNKNLLTLSSVLADKDEPKVQSLEDMLKNDDLFNEMEITYQIIDKKDKILSKSLYISKDFIFIYLLLISTGLNYSYLYFPFLFIAIASYFLLYETGKNFKLFKRIIEIFCIIYSLGLMIFKIYFCIQVKKGNEYSKLFLDLGILNLIDKDSTYFFLASFFGEIFIIIISIYSLIISYISKNIDVSEYENPEEAYTLKQFYSLMNRCIYLFYISVLGWAIFNRSILTLIYIMPMNIILYILAMNYRKKLLFYIFKIFSIILTFIISAHILLINLFNTYSIRDSFLSDDLEIRDNYPRVVNGWTKLGINQAFHKDMKGTKLSEEFGGYICACASLLILMYTNKKMTIHKYRKAYKNSKLNNFDEENDFVEEYIIDEIYMNFWEKLIIRIKKIISNPSNILHVCRISAILWLYYYQNFYSIGVIIWLFFSFLYIRVTSNKFVTIIFLAPMVFVCLFCYHLANIDGFIENKENQKIFRNFALGKFSHKNVEYILCNIFYFLITIFIYTIFNEKIVKKKEKKDDEKIEPKNILKKNIIQKTEEEENKEENIIDNLGEKYIEDEKEENNINIEKEKEKDNDKEDDKLEELASKLNNLIEENNNEVEEETIEELYNNLTIINIIIKAVFLNIDKITLIALYVVAVYSINITHFILVIIFMMQLLFPIFMIKYSVIFIIFSQIIFLIEYCVDLSKNSDYSKNTINLIKLFIPFDIDEISIDFLLYLLTYCFYIQYQLFNYDYFQKLTKNENISLDIYIKVFFHKFPLIQKILYMIGNIIKEIYIWTLISIFIVFNGTFEISIFFVINLLIFLALMYKFLKNVKTKQKSHISLILNWIFLIFCALNTVSVYIFQILCLEIFSINDMLQDTDNFFLNNLPAIGFYRYFNNKLHIKFLPHFISNVISTLFISEMKNLLNKYEEKEKTSKKKIEIEKNFKGKKYELLIEHKKNLDKKKEEEKMKRKRSGSNSGGDLTFNEDSNKRKRSDSNEEIIIKKKTTVDNLFQRTESEDIENTDKKTLLDIYNENKNKISLLDVKYISFSIILILTKSYWIFLFLSICIIFTTYNLSILLIIYIMIFGIIFMRMFYFIISSLSNFIEQGNKDKESPPFFISKLIRYNLIEKVRHLKDNKKFRTLGFKCLILFNFFSYLLIYLDGIYNIIQGGCRSKIYDDCDKNHKKLIGEQGLYQNINEELIISISYLVGFNVNLDKGTVLFAGWVHIFFGALLCFDVYVQNIEDHFQQLVKENRRQYRRLINENILLKPKIYEQQSFLSNINNILAAEKEVEQIKEEENEEEEINTKKITKPKLIHVQTIVFDFSSKDKKEGEELINKFENIFKNAAEEKKVKLSSTNKKMKIIITIKRIFEEVIIFFLICTAISKLNIWSIIYVIFAIFLILTNKTMKKYYILYCFLISAIIVQVSIFVSNLQKSTDPSPDDSIITIMSDNLVLPWYKYYNIQDERAFFFGLGVCHSQINLIWMDFIEVVIIFIYLDYFSYSIYQEGKTIGKSDNGINLFNLHLNSEVREVTKKLSQEEYQKQINCMKYNFGVEIKKDFQSFQYYIENGKDNEEKKEEEKKEEEKKEEEKKEDEDENISPLLRKLKKDKKKEKVGQTNLKDLKSKEMSDGSCMNILRKFIYLSFHNLILILIITISMMISGFISVIYIIISLYFLLTSTKIYLGKPYSYPRAIKKVLRVIILVDILLQIFYQIPFVDTKTEGDEKNESNFYTILGYIGLNKILVFGKDDEGNFEVLIGWEEMVLVLGKAILYLFMSFQILIYTSPNFLEYYLTYIITKNNNLRRVSLMNVFKFNNKRIEIMNQAIKLRQDMATKMENLEKTLEEWNQNIMKKQNELNPDEEINEIKEEEEELNINNDVTGSNDIQKIEEEEEINKKANLTTLGLGNIFGLNKKIPSDGSESNKLPLAKNPLSQSSLVTDSNTLVTSDEPYLTEEQVINKVKEWIINGFLIKLQIGLHKSVANYNNIPEKEKYIYERDIIQGKNQVTSSIENLIETELRSTKISDLTESEMKELKQYFDGSRAKKLEELKKKRKRLSKLKKSAQKAITINQFTKIQKSNEEDKKKAKEEKEKIIEEKKKFIEKRRQESLLLKKKNKINIRSPKYADLRKIGGSNIFAKHLSKSYIIKNILLDILSFFTNNFNWICYFIMILDHIMSYSIISLFYPISIFCFAIMEYPRPKKIYWSICFVYTIIFLIIKFIIQLKIWKKIEDFDKKIKVLENYRIGLKLCEGTFSRDFVLYILFDALVLIALLINNYLLVFAGLYDKREQEIETIYQANERIASTKDLKFKGIDDIKKFNNDYLTKEERKFDIELDEKKIEKINNEEMDIIKQFDKMKLDENDDQIIKGGKTTREKRSGSTFFKRIGKEKEKKKKEKEEEKRKKLFKEYERTYWETLFPKARNEKPGNEFYVYYTVTMTLIIIYIFFFYTNMIKDKTFGAISMQTKQFSGEMVCFLLLHIIFLLADRVIYLRQNRNNLEYQYILYDKINKKIIKNLDEIENINTKFSKFKKNDTIIPTNYADELKNYNIIYIQRETFNKPLRAKYIMHILIVAFGHLFIFFFMPMYGNYKLYRTIYCQENAKECNDFIKNKFLTLFYIVYIAYFISSGLQVKYGFYDMKKKSVLKAKSNSLYGGVYAGYKAVPFLYEIKLGIDWTFTSTCLDLFQWNKFESVYDVIYTTNCAMTSINTKRVGVPVGRGSKIGMGGVLSFLLLAVLVGPLLLFSSLNPTNELNNLTNADLTIELSFIYKNDLMKNYTLYENSKPQSIEPISDEDIEKYNYTKAVDTKNFPREQIQTVTFFEENDRNWDLSRPHITNLIELIKSIDKNITDENENYIKRIDLIMDYSFDRLLPPEAQTVLKRYNTTIFTRGANDNNKYYVDKNLTYLGEALENCSDTNIIFKKKFSPPIRLRATSHPKSMKSKEYFNNLDVQLGFVGCKKILNEENEYVNSYLESYFTFSIYIPETNTTEGVKFHVFSDKVSTTTLSYSVITFYLAFVLVVGNYVRNFFAAQPEKIMLTEMPDNEKLMDLCEGIKISRYSYNFEEEEKLYYILVNIMRSPDILRLLTKISDEQFQNRLKLTKEEEEREKEEEEKKEKEKKDKK